MLNRVSRVILKNKTGAELIYRVLEKHKVSTVFGYTGGAVLPLTDRFHKKFGGKIKHIMNRNENCSGHAAEGYAKASNRLGVVITTSGPGLTNLITPLQDAYSDGVPILAISGQVPTNALGTDAFQECPAIELTKACTKWNKQIHTIEDLVPSFEKAINIALTGRKGPVHIDVPKDILAGKIDEVEIIQNNSNSDSNTNKNLSVNNFIELLSKAKKPIIYAGQGVNNYSENLTKFVKKFNIPITTTLHALGSFDEREHLSLHMLGMHGSVYANYAMQNSDFIIAIGSRFDDRTTGNIDLYAPEARKADREGTGGIIHIDNDKKQIGKVIKATQSYNMDCGDFLNNVLDYSPEYCYKTRNNWLNQINKWKKEHKFIVKESLKPTIPKILKSFSNYVNKNDLSYFVTTGVGNHQMMSAQYIDWTRPKSMITSGSLGTMGSGLPFSIGVHYANPESQVFCLDGDGSFNMTSTELGTIAEHNLPIKIAIFNNKRQQMVHIWQKLFFKKRYMITDNTNPDYVMYANSFGIKAKKCSKNSEIEDIISEWIEYPGPMLVEFEVEPDMCLPLVAPGKALDDMIFEEPIEQMNNLAPN